MEKEVSLKKRILFVQTSSGVGGGLINGLYPIVANLNRAQFEAVVLFYWPNPYREQFDKLGVKTIEFEQPRSWKHPAPVARAQKTAVVKTLQKNNGRLNTVYHALGSYVRLGYYLPQIFRLVKLIKSHKIDLVHLNGLPSGHGREVVLAAKFAGVPIISHGRNFGDFHAVDRQLVSPLVDHYIYCADAVGRYCQEVGGVKLSQGSTIYNGFMDAEKWSRPYDTSAIRQEFGWSDDDFVVGNIGRLVPWKGQDVFLKALAEAQKTIPLKGLIVGGPTASSFYEKLVALTETLGLTEKVHFTGPRSDIPAIMQSVDVVVHSSSRPEPFGMVAAEGMMAGRPVIATKGGGMPEYVIDGVTGLLVGLDKPQEMAQAIVTFYQDRALAERISRRGREEAEKRFRLDRYLGEVEAVYHTLLST